MPEGQAAVAKAAELAARYDGLAAESMLRRVIAEEFPGRLALVSSFGAEAAVLLHLVARIDRRLPVLFIDTGKLFQETLAYRDELVRRLALEDIRTVAAAPSRLAAGDAEGLLWRRDPDACCFLRKVEPLAAALSGFDAWISGRKRYHGGERGALPVFEALDGRVKINPLAAWSGADIDAAFAAAALPRHPLYSAGYLSIGCAPCTRPVAAGSADRRAGRWAGTDKTECGIHRQWTRPEATPGASAGGGEQAPSEPVPA